MIRLACFVVLLLSTGCSVSRSATVDSAEGRALINVRATQGATHVILVGGEMQRVRGLHVAPDSTTWIDVASGQAVSAPTDRVRRVEVQNNATGALRGSVMGMGIALMLTSLATTTLSDDVFQGLSIRDRYVFTGGSGALIGASFGVVHGLRDVYRPQPVPRHPVFTIEPETAAPESVE